MKDYQKHILDTTRTETGLKVSLCSEAIYDWCFQDIDHAVHNSIQEGRLQPCPKCIQIIIDALIH